MRRLVALVAASLCLAACGEEPFDIEHDPEGVAGRWVIDVPAEEFRLDASMLAASQVVGAMTRAYSGTGTVQRNGQRWDDVFCMISTTEGTDASGDASRDLMIECSGGFSGHTDVDATFEAAIPVAGAVPPSVTGELRTSAGPAAASRVTATAVRR